MQSHILGKVGSTVITKALQRDWDINALCRNPAKLTHFIKNNPLSHLTVGNATSTNDLKKVITHNGRAVDALIVAAPMADMLGRRSGYETVVESVVEAVQHVQNEGKQKEKLRIWFMAGAAALNCPEAPTQLASEK